MKCAGMSLIQNQLRMCLYFSSIQTSVRAMNTEFRILLTLRKGRGRTDMGCQSEGNCTLDVFLLQMSQCGGIIRSGETYQWVCHCSMYALLFCVLKLCALTKSTAFVDPRPHFISLLGPKIMSVLDEVQIVVRWHRAGYVASFYHKEEWGVGEAHFTLPPSPKLTAAVKCPALKDYHLKSSSAGPPCLALLHSQTLCLYRDIKADVGRGI